ncbi:RNA polymerase sigma factor [Pseudonocardia humida]|uniref:Sigma-70 family RNA polymerase sigma factor n=1 Tax=Pseudonocardia humida TaxID=2800819 RepID=A0ABT0ZZM6_9PSEU|nr:sigma-70 family RNA polymerase sigma factor [Pseudonocardia humida]MCO1656214.1 sigma-70 family RNA polymerase sigma factor [Pseudonocardia humida]
MSTDVDVTVAALDFARWYGATVEGLTHRVAAAVGDPMLGREATAEAFARAYERWPRIAAMDSPEGWVYRVAVNIGRRSWRQRALESRALARMVPEMIGGGVVGGGADHPAHHPDDVYRAVRKLPRRMRVAIRLRYWDDLTEQQIAERLQVPVGTASSLLTTARARLRRALGAEPTTGGGR